MSPKNPVLCLSDLSLRKVANILIHTLSESYEECNADEVEEYLRETTIEVLQDLLALILRLENLDASTRFSCLDAILRKELYRLDTGMFPNFYYGDILRVIKHKGSGLRHLNLNGVWLRNLTIKLADALEKLDNLRVLQIPHMADDLVLQSLQNLKKLTVLDISGECAFTRSGLSDLNNPAISILDIGYYGKEELWQGYGNSVDLIAHLIKQLPNLTVLKTYSFAGKALLNIYQANKDFTCKLKYIHDTATNSDVLEAVAATCPMLESLNFNSPENGIVKNLYLIKKLNNVKLSRTPCVDVCEFLQHKNNVTSLSLSLLREKHLDVALLGYFAPQLVQLKCFKTSLMVLQPDVYFVNLESVEVLYCDASDEVLKTLLTNSPFLKRVVVADEVKMTDGDVFRLCAESPFLYLQELWLFAAKALTATSVKLLMGHCPNLRVLGQLSGWDVSSSQIDYLKAVINSTNTELTLHP